MFRVVGNARMDAMKKSSLRGVLFCMTTLLGAQTLTACAGDPYAFCDSNTAVASFTLQFSSGLDNFSEDQYAKLRSSTSDVRRVIESATDSKDKEVASGAKSLLVLVKNFENRMKTFDWDISQAITDAATNEAASALATSQSLKNANLVESFVIGTCGMPSTIDPLGATGDTLPLPYIPPPTATDPPTNTIKEDSENLALGTTVANLFQLTLTKAQVACLGAELQGVYDATNRFSGTEAYQSQFQDAFDACSIPFTVPSN